MKRVILVAVLVMAFAVTSSTAGEMKPAIYAGGGLGMPMGPDFLKDYYKMGIGFGGGVGFELSPTFEIVGKVFYNQFAADEDKMTSDFGSVTVGDWKIIEFGADIKYMFTMAPDSKIGPYLVAGAGMANSKTEATVSVGGFDYTGSGSATDISMNIGAGTEFMMSPTVSLWIDGRLVYVATEGDATMYLPFRAGVKIGFGGGANGDGM